MLTNLTDEKHTNKNLQHNTLITYTPKTLTFSPDGSTLAVGVDPDTSSGASRYIHLYNLANNGHSSVHAKVHTDTSTLQLLREVCSAKPISSDVYAGGGVDIALSHDGTSILSTDYCQINNGRIQTVSLNDSETSDLTLLYAGSERVGRCAFSPDGSLATAQVGTKVNVWNVHNNGTLLQSFDLSKDAGALRLTPDCLCFSPDNSTVCSSLMQKYGRNAITMLDLSRWTPMMPHTFFLSIRAELVRQSYGIGRNKFEILVPILKAIKTHKALLGDIFCSHACVSDDGNTLLTVLDGCLYLVKADTPKVEAAEAASTSNSITIN